jgi:hypothetical protein
MKLTPAQPIQFRNGMQQELISQRENQQAAWRRQIKPTSRLASSNRVQQPGWLPQSCHG